MPSPDGKGRNGGHILHTYGQTIRAVLHMEESKSYMERDGTTTFLVEWALALKRHGMSWVWYAKAKASTIQ